MFLILDEWQLAYRIFTPVDSLPTKSSAQWLNTAWPTMAVQGSMGRK